MLVNSNLKKDDPRLKLIERIKNYKLVPGWESVSFPNIKWETKRIIF
jgi:hypothetical protein